MNVYTDTRDATFAELYDIALHDPQVILLTADTGAFKFKDFQQNIPKQFYNVGISEQNAISVAAGLALTGKKVFVFGISPFVTLRCYEQIKLDICSMELPVTILGMGTGYGYSYDGPTHHVTQDISIMRALPGITIWGPSDPTMTGAIVHLAYQRKKPCFIRIDKGPLKALYNQRNNDFSMGLTVFQHEKVMIAATGPMVTQAYIVAERLSELGIHVGIMDIYCLKPFPVELFLNVARSCTQMVTLEEHALPGGFGSLVAETLCDAGVFCPLKRIGIADHCRVETGSREYIRSLDGLNAETITAAIAGLVK